MRESQIIQLLDNFIKQIRLKDSIKAEEIFKKVLLLDCKITQNISRKIYELGEIFIFAEGMRYVTAINFILKTNKKNLFLRLIRQEIIYYSEGEYDFKDMFDINTKDLEIFPDNPHLLNFRSLVYLEQDEIQKALSIINRAIDIQRDNVDFLRNKAIILKEAGQYLEADEIIEYALGIEPNYSSLMETRTVINKRIEDEEMEERLIEIKENVEKHSKALKDIKLEFIEISALFVAILTLVVRIVTFDYVNFENRHFLEIISYQIAINFPWIIGLILIAALVTFIHIMRK